MVYFSVMPESDKPYLEMGQRLEMFRKHLNISKIEMSKQIDMLPQHYRNIANGYKILTTRYLKRIAINHIELNIRWLLTGEGSMLNRQRSKIDQEELNRLEIENNLLRELLRPGDKKE